MPADELVSYLLSASSVSLQNAMLAHMNSAARARKECFALIEKWIAEVADARLLAWFCEHGEELAAVLKAPTLKPRPLIKAENLRESLRKLVESA